VIRPDALGVAIEPERDGGASQRAFPSRSDRIRSVSEFDDERLQGAFRAYLRSVDSLASAAGDTDEKAVLEAADAKRLAELVLRSRLTEAGWALSRRGADVPSAPAQSNGETVDS
jgi:hypothetical protein